MCKIKEDLLKYSTHYNGDLKNDKWHEISWIKEIKYEYRSTFNIVKIDLELYEKTGKINIFDKEYFNDLPSHYIKIKNKEWYHNIKEMPIMVRDSELKDWKIDIIIKYNADEPQEQYFICYKERYKYGRLLTKNERDLIKIQEI